MVSVALSLCGPWRQRRIECSLLSRCGDSGIRSLRVCVWSRAGRSQCGGAVTQCAGPWRTAGNWWTEETWDRDEWDVTLSDGAAYRVFRDRGTDTWFLEGVVD